MENKYMAAIGVFIVLCVVLYLYINKSAPTPTLTPKPTPKPTLTPTLTPKPATCIINNGTNTSPIYYKIINASDTTKMAVWNGMLPGGDNLIGTDNSNNVFTGDYTGMEKFAFIKLEGNNCVFNIKSASSKSNGALLRWNDKNQPNKELQWDSTLGINKFTSNDDYNKFIIDKVGVDSSGNSIIQIHPFKDPSLSLWWLNYTGPEWGPRKLYYIGEPGNIPAANINDINTNNKFILQKA